MQVIQKKGCAGWLAVLSLVLLTIFASLVAVHFHPDLTKSAVDSCLLCQAAHTTTLAVSPAPQLGAVFFVVALAIVAERQKSGHTPAFTLKIRPPPAD
jgi:hypothetical protein